MKSFKMLMVLVVALLGVNVCFGQSILVADGSSSGTYAQFLKEMTATLETAGVSLDDKAVTSSGAVENLDHLVNNDVSMAFMHADVIYRRGQKETTLTDRYQTLVSLFPEDVQFVVKHQKKSMFDKSEKFTDLNDLAGKKVGAAGGGFITVNMVKLLSEVPYTIVEYKTGGEVLAALDSGEIDAAEFTGAAPLPNLKKLGTDYKILPIPEGLASKMSAIYQPSEVTYSNMGSQTAKTVSVRCLLVARVYKTPKMVAQLRAMRKAFYSHLTELQETPGNHKKWSDVDPSNHGPWSWMNLGDK